MPKAALEDLEVPVVLAPLAGGPATVELALAVSEAGGLGFLAAGYKTAAAIREEIERLRQASDKPFGVNLFTAPAERTDPGSYASYVERLRAEARRHRVELGEPRFDDDQFTAKIELLLEARPPFASFVFGWPSRAVVRDLQRAGITVLATVTTPEEAKAAAETGVDALVVQGYEAGGHRGSAVNGEQPSYGLISLLALVAESTKLPLVAAGGVTSGRALAAALAAGAIAGQVGTAFLLCPEAGTAAVHRRAIASNDPTAVTRAFTGKPARGIVNRFIRDHGEAAPAAYPEIHYVTAPLRAAARKADDPEPVNLWAGQAHALAREEPAGEVVARLAGEAREALAAAASRVPRVTTQSSSPETRVGR
ncbi:MAG: nitronate monooxygenase [Solirubrobacterales bacterium]|nr:nitronate monooxygenase [Solirubrobacterales bacterium]